MKIQKALIIVFGFLLSSTAFAGDYSLKTGTGVSKSSNSYLENTKKDYSLDESIYAFVTMKDFQDETSIPQELQAKWYVCGRFVSQGAIKLNRLKVRVAQDEGEHHSWFWEKSQNLGSGYGNVDIYADGKKVATSDFRVRDANGNFVSCQKLADVEKYVLNDNLLFHFDGSKSNQIYGGGAKKIDVLASRIRSEYSKINSIVFVGHTDYLGSNQYNLKLSKKRADTVRRMLAKRGVSADHVRIVAKGESQIIKSCKGVKNSSLTACLAPNRRVEVIVDGIKRK